MLIWGSRCSTPLTPIRLILTAFQLAFLGVELGYAEIDINSGNNVSLHHVGGGGLNHRIRFVYLLKQI